MSRFNAKKLARAPVRNASGKPAYKRSPEVELTSLLLSSFVSDTYYQSAQEALQRLVDLVDANKPAFAAKAALFARTIMNMRSASHVVAAALARHAFPNKAAFYHSLVVRPDDITETLAAYALLNPRTPRPTFNNAMKRGFGRALSAMNAYQLAKYRAGGSSFKLVDAVNICHPRSTEALAALVAGTLAPADTWEVALTQAGQTGSSKAEAWASLVAEGKLGHMALLRNLRNIMTHAPAAVPAALKQLLAGVGKARVFPYRYAVAGDAIADLPGSDAVYTALSQCIDKACLDLPALPGRTLVACDNSGSMVGSYNYSRHNSGHKGDSPARKAAIFGAALALTSPSELVVFSSTCKRVPVVAKTLASILAQQILASIQPASTNFQSVIDYAARADQPFDRIIFLTDGEANIGAGTAQRYLNDKFGQTCGCTSKAAPKIFLFDLAGQNTSQFTEDRVFLLSGLSEQALKLIGYLEQDRNLLVNLINEVTF